MPCHQSVCGLLYSETAGGRHGKQETQNTENRNPKPDNGKGNIRTFRRQSVCRLLLQQVAEMENQKQKTEIQKQKTEIERRERKTENRNLKAENRQQKRESCAHACQFVCRLLTARQQRETWIRCGVEMPAAANRERMI